ncbi:MAG: D-alanyl-D-alanine carboxypeptidase [Oscillospiraceae bacterium]|nr:D-alanyl-D-alanine carboxypeptidase [Oscillospiraceae bacterium]
MKNLKSLKNPKNLKKILIGSVAFILIFILIISSVQGIITSPENQGLSNRVIYSADDLYNMSEIHAVPIDNNTANSAAANSKKPQVDAQSAILIDATNVDVIFELNAHQRLPMASTTKIMTAIVAIESGVPLDKIVTIAKEMTGIEGTSIYLSVNERFTLLDLIYALLLNSANDAAEAIAISVGGSVDKFADMMNAKAQELNLKDTHFTNPHGLDDDQHYTTAYDLAKIAAYALENENFYEIAGEKTHIIYPKNADGTDNKAAARYLSNHNKMLKLYKDSIGVKTGYTKRSGRCLVSAAERDGTRLVAVTLNASDDWNDHIEMLDYGFANYHSIDLCKENEYQFDVHVVNGYRINADGKKETVSSIKCENISAESASVLSAIKSEDITYKTELPQFIYAPVKKGDIVGRMVFMYNDYIVGYSIIVSYDDVEVVPQKKPNPIIAKIQEFFGKSKD